MQRNLIYKMVLTVASGVTLTSPLLGKDLPSEFLPHSVVAEPVLIDTQETIVESHQQKFRQIEFKGDRYLVSFEDRDQTHDDEPICVREIAEELPKNPETLTPVSETRTGHHRESFVQGLKLRCQKLSAPSPFEVGLKMQPGDLRDQASAANSEFKTASDSTEKNAGLSTRDRMKREINAQDARPAFGAPGSKSAAIPF